MKPRRVALNVSASAPQRVWGIRLTPARRLLFFVVIDAALVVTGMALAVAARFDGAVPVDVLRSSLVLAAIAAPLVVLANQALRVYRVSWGFVGLRDIARLAVGVWLATAAATAIWWIQAGGSFGEIPRSVPLLGALFASLLMGVFRLSKRAARFLSGQRQNGRRSRLLIVGAGTAGAQVLKSIQDAASHQVVGFVDDDALARGTLIHGVPVWGSVDEMERVVKAMSVETVVICIATARGDFVRDIVERSRRAGAKAIRIVPPVNEIVEGGVTFASTREVSLEDLLGREAVRIDHDHVASILQGRAVLVTGGAGTIGSELCRQIARFSPAKLGILDIDETRLADLALELRERHPGVEVREVLLDVRDAQGLRDHFARAGYDVVFHAAAYKHVPIMEKWPITALQVNVLGTSNVVRAARAARCQRIVLISTDKAVEPSSVMGASKRLAEFVLREEAKGGDGALACTAVRFGNVIGSRGSVIPIFERQLAQGGPLTVTHPDMERFFMMTSEAVSLVLQAAALGDDRAMYILEMGKPVRILDVAKEFIRLHGLEPEKDVQIRFTGLRPGEKLTEKLAYPDEQLAKTEHPRILRAAMNGNVDVPSLLSDIKAVVETRDEEAALAFLRKEFPSLASFDAPMRPS